MIELLSNGRHIFMFIDILDNTLGSLRWKAAQHRYHTFVGSIGGRINMVKQNTAFNQFFHVWRNSLFSAKRLNEIADKTFEHDNDNIRTSR